MINNFISIIKSHSCQIITIIMLNLAGMAFADGKYDPLKLPENKKNQIIDFTLKDKTRNREIPVKIYLPAQKKTQPIVIFSHGLGGSCKNNPYLGNHWASRGYVAVFMQHPGSDTSAWKGKPLLQRMTEMKKAASLQNFLLRVQDVHFLIDQLEFLNKQEGNKLKSRLDLNKIGMSGHSFGAITTQAVSGQQAAWGKTKYTDKRISAAVMFSPSPPALGSVSKVFGKVEIPWMLMTGTLDDSIISSTKPEDRLKVYPALPEKDKYELVLYNAEHSAFGDRRLPGEKQQRNPNHHRAILALTTAFWDSYLKNDPEAKKWLSGDQVYSVLEKQDRWQKK